MRWLPISFALPILVCHLLEWNCLIGEGAQSGLFTRAVLTELSDKVALVTQLQHCAILMEHDAGCLPTWPLEPGCGVGRPPEHGIGRLVVEHVRGRRDVVLGPHGQLS